MRACVSIPAYVCGNVFADSLLLVDCKEITVHVFFTLIVTDLITTNLLLIFCWLSPVCVNSLQIRVYKNQRSLMYYTCGFVLCVHIKKREIRNSFCYSNYRLCISVIWNGKGRGSGREWNLLLVSSLRCLVLQNTYDLCANVSTAP